MTTVGEAISRVRNVLKAVKEDPFLTDRLIYSLIMKVAKTLIKRDDRIESLFKYKSLFKEFCYQPNNNHILISTNLFVTNAINIVCYLC